MTAPREPERILVVHNRYQMPGGEDVAYEAEAALLESHGHAVERLEFTNDAIEAERSALTTLKLAKDTVWSSEPARRVAERARAFRADLVHFHNTFPIVSPAAFGAARRTGAAVVASLHNYRLACPAGSVFRDGARCTDCVGKAVPWPGVLHACYRDSRAQTAAVAAMLGFHRARRTWSHDVDLYLTPSAATREVVARHLPGERVVVKPNFAADPGPASADRPREGSFFAGRLIPEKGVRVLLEAWTSGGAPDELTIVGDGALRGEVERAASAHPRVTYLGQVERATVVERMRRAAAVVVPSIWDEPFGLVAVEAYAVGTPVIAARTGALPEIVGDGETGLLYDASHARELASKVAQAAGDARAMRAMGAAARARYTPEANYELLVDAYREALRRRAAG